MGWFLYDIGLRRERVKFIKITSNSAQNKQKTQKSQKDKKTCYPKESAEDAGLYKPVLNKIMTPHMREIQFRSSFDVACSNTNLSSLYYEPGIFRILEHSKVRRYLDPCQTYLNVFRK